MIVSIAKPQTSEQEVALIRLRSRVGDESGHDPYVWGKDETWLIFADDEIVGYTGIHSVDPIAMKCRSHSWIVPDARGRGIGTEALRLIFKLLFTDYDMHRIEFAVESENAPMNRLANRIARFEGQVLEASYYGGRYHDSMLYGLLKAEWKGKE